MGTECGARVMSSCRLGAGLNKFPAVVDIMVMSSWILARRGQLKHPDLGILILPADKHELSVLGVEGGGQAGSSQYPCQSVLA